MLAIIAHASLGAVTRYPPVQNDKRYPHKEVIPSQRRSTWLPVRSEILLLYKFRAIFVHLMMLIELRKLIASSKMYV